MARVIAADKWFDRTEGKPVQSTNVRYRAPRTRAIRMDACWPEGLDVADSWKMMALVDRLVELSDLAELRYGDCAGQHRVFMWRDR